MSRSANVRRGAIVGFGNVAANGHLPGWKAHPEIEIVAVVDPDRERCALAKAEIPGARTYSDLTSLLARESIDFVDVASPPAHHAAAIHTAAAAGVHVLCEKPLTTSLAEYHELRRVSDAAGIVLHTVHNWKYSEAFQLAQRIVAAGQIGKLESVVFDTARNGCSVATRDNWRVDAAVAGGGILVDHGWHAFYLLLTLAQQRPWQIRATMEKRRYVEAGVEDTVRCTIDLPSVVGEIRLTWAAEQRHTRWELRGDMGELVIDDDRVILRSEDGEQVHQLSTPLSAGSHHADWFAGVIDELQLALRDPASRQANQAEAELCVLMLSLAYASAAQGAQPQPIPESLNPAAARGAGA